MRSLSNPFNSVFELSRQYHDHYLSLSSDRDTLVSLRSVVMLRKPCKIYQAIRVYFDTHKHMYTYLYIYTEHVYTMTVRDKIINSNRWTKWVEKYEHAFYSFYSENIYKIYKSIRFGAWIPTHMHTNTLILSLSVSINEVFSIIHSIRFDSFWYSAWAYVKRQWMIMSMYSFRRGRRRRLGRCVFDMLFQRTNTDTSSLRPCAHTRTVTLFYKNFIHTLASFIYTINKT